MGPSAPPLSSPTAVRCSQPKGRSEGGRVNLAVTLRNLFSKSQRIAGGEAGGLRIVTRAATGILRGARLRAAGPAALASNLNAGGPMSTTSIAPLRVGRQGASTHLNRCRKALAQLSRALGPTGSAPSACSPKRSVPDAHRPQVINEVDDARREGFSARPGQSRLLWHRWSARRIDAVSLAGPPAQDRQPHMDRAFLNEMPAEKARAGCYRQGQDR
jgi:hypothetical protein